MKVSELLAAALALVALSSLPASHAACDAKPKKQVKPKAIPSLLMGYRNGWKLTAEINDKNEKSTVYLIEYYNTERKEGFLRFKQDGRDDVNLYYISSTSELFVYQKGSCRVADVRNPPDPVKSLIHEWRNWRNNFTLFTILGPSALFAKAWMAQSKELYYQGPGEPIRGIKSLQWAACYPGDDDPTLVWFADPEWDAGYGTGKSLPLRITTGPRTIDIMMMQPYQSDDDGVLKIPTGLGCKRLAKDLPMPPNFSNLDLEFHVEMAFTNPSVLGPDHYLSHLEVIRDDRDSLLSVTGADWTSAKKVIHSPIVSMQRIYDYANGHTYTYVDSSGRYGCKVRAQDNVRPIIQLPDISEINMMDTILPNYDVLKKASYLGIQSVRGMPVHTYELVTDPMPVGGAHLTHAVLIYSFLAERAVMDTSVNQKNLPVRVAMYAYVSKKTEPYFYFFANIHDITTEMMDLNKKLNVKNCYQENESEFTWVQLGFPVSKHMVLLMINRANIKRRFMAELQRVTKLSPLRTPDVMIDFTENMVYITVLILGHPAISADYKEIQNKKIMEPDWSEGVITQGDCLKTCSSNQYKDCSAVSYCGSFCSTTTKKDVESAGVLENSVECNTFVATLVAETIEYSTGGLRDVIGEKDPDLRHFHQQGLYLPKDFSEYGVGARLKTSASYGMHVGSFAAQDCADICRDREDCFAFSTCLASKQFTRYSYNSRIDENSSESFQSSFEELPGICYSFTARKYVNVSQPAECAAMCLNEKEFVCKAFDFCTRSRKGKPVCRLQDKHILEVSDPADLDRSDAEKCSHYTRKHISDYRKDRLVRLLGTPRTVIKKVSEAECARQCWEASFRCDRFDHCAGKRELGKGDCLLYDGDKGPYGTVMSPICNSYTYTGNYDRQVAKASSALHTNAKATGLSFFMIFLGGGVAVAALFAYGFYKTRQAGRG
ncbi:hypothetical protein HPB49_015031 [Dermacentor silvarum]|uniref:Uncharacterized protein n=1 Tax=Dermacentor silvarum TaxID=543639 RepID=A0ACB8DPV3_DERSI|nr:hypothetical protein HPB49_015031 [Dermacentor silvarum]